MTQQIARVLTQPVRITGQDFFGRQSSIIFRPTTEEGWFWQHSCSEPPIPITADLLESKKRRLALSHGKNQLNIFEHLGGLKWCGFPNLVICSDKWPPYWGRSWEIYEKLIGHSTASGNKPAWCTVNSKVTYHYPGGKRKKPRFIEIYPSDKRQLELEVICDYPKIGGQMIVYLKLPEESQQLENMLQAYTPGWPPSSFQLGWLASKILRWPHFDKVTWPQRHNGTALHSFARHRVMDLLGALSILHPTRLLSAKVVSQGAGHWGDQQVIHKAQKHLVLLDP